MVFSDASGISFLLNLIHLITLILIGNIICCISGPQPTPSQFGGGEKPSQFKGPKLQEMIQFRKVIESGNLEEVRRMVWENPRYLVSSGDTPSILQVMACSISSSWCYIPWWDLSFSPSLSPVLRLSLSASFTILFYVINSPKLPQAGGTTASSIFGVL